MPKCVSLKTADIVSRIRDFFPISRSFGRSFALVLFCLTVGSIEGEAGVNLDSRLEELLSKYSNQYPTMHVPKVELEYMANLKRIPSLNVLRQQAAFFSAARAELNSIEYQKLSLDAQVRFTWFKDILENQIERVHLETGFKESGESVPDGGLFKLPNHGRWYDLYSRRFASRFLFFEDIRKIGIKETARIRQKMRDMQNDFGYAGRDEAFYAHLNSESFQNRNLQSVLREYEARRLTVERNIPKLFNAVRVAQIKIGSLTDANKDTPPGLYNRGDRTFYFSFFGHRHNNRSMDWLLLHEALPGHHYQYDVEDKATDRPAFATLVKQYGFIEGWGAYVETLGSDLGLYKDSYSAFGRLEWDLVRSVRLAIDVGIHAEGWTKAKAVAFWMEQIPNQNEIAEREIDRIIRWPAQVISYKTGELAINELEQLLRSCTKSTFDRRRFHQLLLERGSIPFLALRVVFEQELKSQGCNT